MHVHYTCVHVPIVVHFTYIICSICWLVITVQCIQNDHFLAQALICFYINDKVVIVSPCNIKVDLPIDRNKCLCFLHVASEYIVTTYIVVSGWQRTRHVYKCLVWMDLNRQEAMWYYF